jgi:hypothetical protein
VPAAELRLRSAGIYRVTHEQLLAAGVDLGGAPAASVGLTSRGLPVPILVGGGARFGPGSFVEFVGEPVDSLYTRENVYRLVSGAGSPARVARDRARPPRSRPAPFVMTTARLGARREYAFASPTGDPWFDTRMMVTTKPEQWAFTFAADGYAGPVAPVTLAVHLFGGTDLPAAPDHHLEIVLNGATLADVRFDGIAERRVTATVPPGLLREQGNELVLRLGADLGTPFDVVHLQDYAITYPRRLRAVGDAAAFSGAGAHFDVPGLGGRDVVAYRCATGGVTRLDGVRVRRDPAGGYVASVPGAAVAADYRLAAGAAILIPRVAAPRAAAGLTDGPARLLVIAHRDFVGGLAPLVATRVAQGLTVKVADVEDVYARFSGGIVDPEAMRAYVKVAAATMGTEFVLLVGGDTFDYLGILGAGARSFVPSLYAPTGPVVRFAPVDPAIADLDGDGAPDLAIGRLPVRTRAELDAVVAKTLAYERKDYARTAILVADRSEPGALVSYGVASEAIAASLGRDWSVRRLYLDELVPANLHTWLIEAIDNGAALTSFVGHSGPAAWTPDAVLSVADVKALTNAARPTVVIQWGCWNSYFVSPSDALGPALLLSPSGAAATLGATALADDTSENELAGLLAAQLAVPGIRLGTAVQTAKRQLAARHPGLADVQLGWTLLGDPTLVVGP